jgi:RNA polymerase sigma-70 factor, ECF subfamily
VFFGIPPLAPSAYPGGPQSAPDEATTQWLSALGSVGSERERALARLHDLLLRVARAELGRRAGRQSGYRAGTGRPGPPVGRRCTTCHHREAGRIPPREQVTTGLGSSWSWRSPASSADTSGSARRSPSTRGLGSAPDRLGTSPADHAERQELVAAVRGAVEEELTDHQRQVFTAMMIDGIPLDALVAQLGSSRNAVYKTMFDARHKHRPPRRRLRLGAGHAAYPCGSRARRRIRR